MKYPTSFLILYLPRCSRARAFCFENLACQLAYRSARFVRRNDFNEERVGSATGRVVALWSPWNSGNADTPAVQHCHPFFLESPHHANLVVCIASLSISYFDHAKSSFRSCRSHRERSERFALVTLTTYGLTIFIMYLVNSIFNRDSLLATIAVASSIPDITWAFARFWVFREP